MTTFTRRLRWLSAGGLLVLLVVLWLLFLVRTYTNPIIGYRVVDERTIVLQVTGADRVWTRVAKVTETSPEVRITVESLSWFPLPGSGVGKLVELTVHLAEPLDDRVVKDGEGNPVPQPVCSDNICSPAPWP